MEVVVGEVVIVPEVGTTPDHAPDVVQRVALVEDHVRVLEPPVVTVEGVAVRVTVADGGPLARFN